MRRPVVAVLVLAIVGVAGFGAWATTQEDDPPRFCKADAWLAPAPPGHEGAWVPTEDQGEPGRRDDCDTEPVPEPIADQESLVLGFDCAYRDVDGAVVATTEPNLPGGLCGKAAG